LKKLKKLDLEGSIYLNVGHAEDVLLKCSTIKSFKGEEELMEVWESLVSSSDVTNVQDGLYQKDIKKFSQSVLLLEKELDMHTKSYKSHLYKILKVNDELGTPALVPALDKNIERLAPDLDISILLALLRISLRNNNHQESSFNFTLICVEEILKRKDVSAQQEIVKLFLKSRPHEDPDNENIHDILIKKYFARFCIEAQAELLKDYNKMMPDGGRGLEKLFISAFAAIDKADSRFELIANRLVNYYKDNKEDMWDGFFDELLSEIHEKCNENVWNSIKQKLAEIDVDIS
jgi:hypothetical protein